MLTVCVCRVLWFRDGVDDPLEDHALVTQQLDQVVHFSLFLSLSLCLLSSLVIIIVMITKSSRVIWEDAMSRCRGICECFVEVQDNSYNVDSLWCWCALHWYMCVCVCVCKHLRHVQFAVSQKLLYLCKRLHSFMYMFTELHDSCIPTYLAYIHVTTICRFYPLCHRWSMVDTLKSRLNFSKFLGNPNFDLVMKCVFGMPKE